MLEYLTLGQFVVAVLMGLAALCAFLWGVASGAFHEVEAVKHRVLEVEGPTDAPPRS
jgi:cbb3-type cytochrome oxidase maturation protein